MRRAWSPHMTMAFTVAGLSLEWCRLTRSCSPHGVTCDQSANDTYCWCIYSDVWYAWRRLQIRLEPLLVPIVLSVTLHLKETILSYGFLFYSDLLHKTRISQVSSSRSSLVVLTLFCWRHILLSLVWVFLVCGHMEWFCTFSYQLLSSWGFTISFTFIWI